MALYRSDAFVLRTYKLGESDQIVVLFTETYGKVRAVARRSRSTRRQTASYYQPLMLLHVILFGRPAQPACQGRTIKAIGTRARQAIRHMLRTPVHLHLVVRVKKGWREHDATLRALGFGAC